MHGERIYYSDQNLNAEQQIAPQGSNTHFLASFRHFLNDFREQNIKTYHKQIQHNLANKRYILNIKLADLKAHDQTLYDRFMTNPIQMLGVMEEGLKAYVREKSSQFNNVNLAASWQAIILSDQNPKKLRNVTSNLVGKMFVVQGIIISTTKPYIKASKLKIQCRHCQLVKIIDLQPGQFPYVPSFCPGQGESSSKCPNDPFLAMPDSEVIDTQNLKIQQNPEEIPSGQVARTYSMIADRFNVSQCVPGDRVRITGIMMVHDLGMQNLSKGQIYVCGIEKIKERSLIKYSMEEEEEFKKMAKDPKIYEKIYKSIAPAIYGNEDIKKAIACMLFGGSRKKLPDSTVLRGDINILLIGDPSTAKSQFLKFVEQTAAIAIYTSGKGSSAAGLTASITKDMATGEFQIQGGALVLADNGIVCIDEFDKMKPQDRVAIHEAMQQQTISVAKAGITTRLNSRTSILAAANPIRGRCAQLIPMSQQIQLQVTILSRFDCIFIVRDINTAQNNERIANHILQLHQGKLLKDQNSDIHFQKLKKYIAYSRRMIHPRLSVTACQKLRDSYVADRQTAKGQNSTTKNAMPITVRQLQAIIRLSQSLAKMKLRSQVNSQDVEQAHHLFTISTMQTISGKQFGLTIPEAVADDVLKAEEAIKKRIPIGQQVNTEKLIDDLNERFHPNVVSLAINNMVRNEDLRELNKRKMLIRNR